MASPSVDTPYSFIFDGRIWACRPVPEELWRNLMVLCQRRPRNRRARRRYGDLSAEILMAIVIDADELLARLQADPEQTERLAERLVQDAMPGLFEHHGVRVVMCG